MNLFRNALLKLITSYTLVFSLLGLHIIPIANAANPSMERLDEQIFIDAASGDYSGLKNLSKSSSGTVKSNINSYTPPEGTNSLFGDEDNRNFNNSHTTSDGSDNGIKTSGTLFKVEMENNPEAVETKAYNALNKIYNDPKYHSSNIDNEELGKKITLRNAENTEMLAEYERLTQEAESGTMCHIEVVSEAVKETQLVTEAETCMYSDSPVYWSSSCQVTRTLTLPGVENVDGLLLNDSNNGVSTTKTGSITYPRDLALNKPIVFNVEDIANVGGSIQMPSGIPDNHYIFVNGNRISNNSTVSISEFLVEGVNSITASCSHGPLADSAEEIVPIGSEGLEAGSRAEFCSTTGDPNDLDGVLLRGDIKWGDPSISFSNDRKEKAFLDLPECPTGYYYVGYDDNYDRALPKSIEMVRRCFKPYEEPICQELSEDIQTIINQTPNATAEDAEYLYWYDKLRNIIFNPAPKDPADFNWPSITQAKPDGKIVPLSEGNYIEYEDPSYSSNTDEDTNHPNDVFDSSTVNYKATSYTTGWDSEDFSRKSSNFDGFTYFDPDVNDFYNADSSFDMYRGFFELRNYGDGSSRMEIFGYFIDQDDENDTRQYGWHFMRGDQSCLSDGRTGEYKEGTLGPCRVPSLEGSLGMISEWEGLKMTDQYSGHPLLTSTYGLACGHPTKNLPITFSYANAIQEIEEIPQNCVGGENQYVQDLDGNYHYNLQGTAFPYTDSPTPPSTDKWQCLDSSANRLHGNTIQAEATMNHVGNSIQPMFPGDLNDDEICYEAEAPKYGVDITSVGKCPDGTFSCWDSELYSHVPSELGRGKLFVKNNNSEIVERFLAFVNPIQPAYATLEGANTVGDVSSVNLCEDLANNPSCSYVSQECTLTDELSGMCRLWDKLYTCTYEKEVVVTPAITKKVCRTPYPCSEGEDEYCTYVDETTDSFQDAAVALSVAQFAKDDSECLSSDISTCSMFNGDAQDCRSYVSSGLGGGLPSNNCCSKPDGAPGPVAYLKTLYAISQTEYVQSMASSIASTITSTGIWQDYVVAPAEYVGQLATEAYDATADWFANQATSLGYQAGTDVAASAGTEAATQGIGASISSGANFLMADISQIMGDVLGDWIVEDVIRNEATGEILVATSDLAAGETLEQVGAEAAQQAGVTAVESTAIDAGVVQAIGSAFSVVMAIYAAYKVTMLVNDMLIACGGDEFEAAYKVNSGSCLLIDKKCTSSSAVDSCKEKTNYYCCYSSPLAKIIHQQASLTGQSSNPLEYDTSDAKTTYNNGCPGFTYEEFSNLDFDRIDLSDWVDLLIDSGKLPGTTEESMDAFTNIDNVTRSVAKNQEGYDPETTTVPNAQGRAEAIMGTAGDNYEEYRNDERDSLIMDDQYETLYEDCWYAHGEGESYDGTQGYVIYADGSKHNRTACLKKEGGAVYPHQTEECEAVTVVNEDGSETEVVPITTFMIGKFAERVDLAVCVES